MQEVSMQFQVLFHYDHRDKSLDVRAGFLGSEFEGSVKKVIRKGQLTAGLREDGAPVYVRIREAQKLGEKFYDAAVALSASNEPNKKTRDFIAKKCLTIMREMVTAYQKKNLDHVLNPKQIDFTFQQVPATA
jgi:hypothetical protein